MESVLAKCVEDNLLKELNDSRTPFIGLMLDETCDMDETCDISTENFAPCFENRCYW